MLHEKNPHPRDFRLEFVESSHTYYVDGTKDGYISCTSLVHNMFEKFDADVVISKMMSSRNWPNSPYFGMEADDIKKKWDANRDAAAQAGTAMHENIEMFYNEESHEENSKEFELFSKYLSDHNIYRPHRTEWCIFDEEARVCGSVDMIYDDPDRPGYHIIADWKRSKAIKTENRWQSGIHRYTAHLPDCNFIHYSLQLAIYKYILEKKYGRKISKTFIVVLHPQQETYQKIYTRDLSTEVEGIMKERLEGGSSVGLFDMSRI